MKASKSGPGKQPVRGATTPGHSAPKAKVVPNQAFKPKSRGFKGKISN